MSVLGFDANSDLESELRVELVAHTTVDFEDVESKTKKYEKHSELAEISEQDELAEVAGRLCYQSWYRPNPRTASNSGYLENIINHQHFSVLEHSSATFYVTGTSRALLKELARHRHLSLSVLSQRYVDYSNANVVLPRGLHELEEYDAEAQAVGGNIQHRLRQQMKEATYWYDWAYNELRRTTNWTKKQCREVARAFLPESTPTEFLVTGNFRAWREFLTKRDSDHADKEIQLLASTISNELTLLAPNSFQDFIEGES